MYNYDKRLPETYNHRPSCAILEYLQLKTELEYKTNMLNNANGLYEQLIAELLRGKEVIIDSKKYKLTEISNA